MLNKVEIFTNWCPLYVREIYSIDLVAPQSSKLCLVFHLKYIYVSFSGNTEIISKNMFLFSGKTANPQNSQVKHVTISPESRSALWICDDYDDIILLWLCYVMLCYVYGIFEAILWCFNVIIWPSALWPTINVGWKGFNNFDDLHQSFDIDVELLKF